MHILCIDDDSSLCQAIEKEAIALGIPITIALTIEQASKKMAGGDFSAYILSSKYLAGRLSMKKSAASLVYHDLPVALQLKELKSIHQISWVAGKPMSSNEAHYLLSKICNIPNRFEPICDWVDEIPEKLMNEYFKIAYERLNHIADLLQEAKINPSELVWEALQNTVHKIAGSAGMYGRTMASEICRKMELQLKNKNYANLDSFYRQLYLYIQ